MMPAAKRRAIPVDLPTSEFMFLNSPFLQARWEIGATRALCSLEPGSRFRGNDDWLPACGGGGATWVPFTAEA